MVKRVSVLFVILLAAVMSKHVNKNHMYDQPIDNREKGFGLAEEYIRHIHSMINAYRGDDLGSRIVIETNALIDTKYKTWKRNADIINSLLALPKGMNDAGR